jgi:predicted porin
MGYFGLDLGARYWLEDTSWGRLGPEITSSVALELVNVLDKNQASFPLDFGIGARYARGFGPFSLEGGLGFVYTTLPVFQYEDESLTTSNVVNLGQPGALLSLGAALDLQKFYLSFGFSEAFVPFPVVTTLALGADYQFSGPLTLHLGGSFKHRSASLASGDEGEGSITHTRLGLQAGVGLVF